MEKEARQLAYKALLQLSEKQGYITFDNIMDYADQYALPIQDFDWLSNSLTTFGIIIYPDTPTRHEESSDDEYDDFAQSNYDDVYRRIVERVPSLQPFVNEVKNIIPPQRKEIRQLKYQIAEGNRFARQRMIEMHLRIALRIALQRSETYDMDLEDAIGYACIGLIVAVDKYDPDTSGPFSSYATLWILQNISREQSTQRKLVYYPVHKKDGYFAMYPVLKRYGCLECDKILGCKKAMKIIIDKIDCQEKDAVDVLSMMVSDEYYQDLIEENKFSEDEDLELGCVLAKLSPKTITNDDETLEMSAYKDAISKAFDQLSDRETEVLRERYGFYGAEKTLEEVGQKFGVTRERIRQIEAKALRKLAHLSKFKYLKEYY